MKPTPIYLDHNATTFPLPSAAAAVAEWLARGPANPSSVHGPGRAARAAVERARRAVGRALGGAPAEVVFTSGATEALHLAIIGLVPPGGEVLISAVEHPAVRGACAVAGARIRVVPVDESGRISVDAVLDARTAETAAVCIMRAQNEIGALYPVAEIADALGSTPLICDAAQALGRIPVDVGRLGATAVVISSHKIGGPPGAGALWVKSGTQLRPFLAGGPQERGRRAGTENVPAIVGFGVAVEAIADRQATMDEVRRRRDRIAAALHGIEGFIEHGVAPRLPNTLAGRIGGLDGDLLLSALDLEGISLSSGSACSSGGVEPSAVLLAMGLTPEQARGGLRISLGPETTDDEVDRFIATFRAVVDRARRAQRPEHDACA